ncbi:J domain-containing protein [Myxococcota bacterium]|nr:J domain-containing protein [Myxococcota bacterium]
MSEMTNAEIRALSKIIDQLDYYRILSLQPDAGSAEIRRAYHATSRCFHPDVRRRLNESLESECARISKRVTEAYCVLRDPRRRQAYDAKLSRKEGLRIQLAEARAAHQRESLLTRQGRTAQGRDLYRKATEAMADENWPAALQSLQLALTFESDNTFFQDQLDSLRAAHPSEA